MCRSAIPTALAELLNPSTPEAQIAALRSLKNEIVGHEQRKELAVTHGIVKPLARLLRGEVRKGGKQRRSQASGHASGRLGDGSVSSPEWTTEDELRFQAILVVGSLANGGPAFVTPLLAGNILPPLLEALRLSETPAKLVTTSMRTLNQIVDAVLQEKSWAGMSDTSPRSTLMFAVSEQIYARPVIDNLAEILLQPAGMMNANQQISLATRLLMKTCQKGNQKEMLVDAGILDILATKLTIFATCDEEELGGGARTSHPYNLSRASLPDIIEAIAAIIKDSHYHTARFLYSQPIQELFVLSKEHARASDDGSTASSQSSWDRMIPRVQALRLKLDHYTKSDPSVDAWPAIGPHMANTPLGPYGRLVSVEYSLLHRGTGTIVDQAEMPFFIWLMYVARRSEGRERLSACWLLALLKKFGEKWPLDDPLKETRESHFSYLIIPLVVKMIEESSPTSEIAKKAYAASPAAKEEMRFVLERSPLVLAELVAGNQPLQSAAFETKIIPTLVQILKRSFDTVPKTSKPLWQPRSSSHEVKDASIDPALSTLGRSGLNADILHAFKYRESVLLALAALAGDLDTMRKSVIETGAAPHIIEAMVPYTEDCEPGSTSPNAKNGNPEAVLVAACKVTRSLSRSVSVLRTSLIDHGVAQPVYQLLKHPSVKVQIAATEVITNLVLEMSPMRSDIIKAGVLQALCEQCRSANFNLRFCSLWALKHLCLGLPTAMKMHCLNDLGADWFIQLLSREPSRPTMATPNAAGEQVDILNAIDEPDESDLGIDETLSDEDSDEADEGTVESALSTGRVQHLSSRYPSAAKIQERLEQIKNDEYDPRINSERDEIRIQEQALDFLRNFIAEEHSTGSDAIEHLLRSFGRNRLFDLLDAKIRPKNSSSLSQSQSGSVPASYWSNPAQRNNINWSTYPSPEIILSAVFVLVHIANGHSHHCSLIMSQTSLMHHLLPIFYHPKREIRACCIWALHNLLWLEHSRDEAPMRERALTLRALGFEDAARTLLKDNDLDVSQRAKTVVDRFDVLLGEGNQAQGPVQGMGLELGQRVAGFPALGNTAVVAPPLFPMLADRSGAEAGAGAGAGAGSGSNSNSNPNPLARSGGLHGWRRHGP